MRKFKNIKVGVVFLFAILMVGSYYFFQKNKTSSNPLDCSNCNLIVISMTTVGTNHMSLYGYNRETDTNIKKFAQKALVFDNAYSQAPQTVSSGLSIFTSLFPYSHKILNRVDEVPLDNKMTTLAEALKKSGYKTSAFTAGGDYSRKKKYGFDRGFDEYNDSYDWTGNEGNITMAMNYLKENKNKKFFMFLQSYDAHCPFNPPAPYNKMYNPDYEGNLKSSKYCYRAINNIKSEGESKEKLYSAKQIATTNTGGNIKVNDVTLEQKDLDELIALKDGAIKRNDDFLKGFFDKFEQLGLGKNTIVVFMSEHGDSFDQEEYSQQDNSQPRSIYTKVIQIPLIMRLPNVRQQKRIDGLVQAIDIMPTILSMLKINQSVVNQKMQGSVLNSLINEGKEVNRYVYSSNESKSLTPNFPIEEAFAEIILNKDWLLYRKQLEKGLSQDEFRFYDLIKDPKNINNLWDKNLPKAIEMKEILLRWIKDTKDYKL